MKRVSTFMVLCLFGNALLAQVHHDLVSDPASATTSILDFRYHYGAILPHSETIRDISDSNPWGFELTFSRLSSALNSWQKCNCYNKWGASFSYVNFANPEVLGNTYNLMFFFEPIIINGKRFELTGKAAMGLAYLNNIYDPLENPRNLFFSTRFSFPLFLNLNINYQLYPQWHITASANYNHISNGGIKQPNKGINYPTLALGAGYVFKPLRLPERSATKAQYSPLQKYLVVMGTTKSVNDSTEVKQGRKMVVGIQAGIMKKLGGVYGISAGFEGLYDGSFRQKARTTGEDYQTYVLSLVVGNNLLFGNFHFSQQFGIYWDPPTPGSRPVFQRYALDYHVLPRVKVGISLKAHGHVAENIDLRAGMVF